MIYERENEKNNIKIYVTSFMDGHLTMTEVHLSHPLVLDLGNLGVRVTHHGDQQVDQQDEDNRQEEEAQNL